MIIEPVKAERKIKRFEDEGWKKIEMKRKGPYLRNMRSENKKMGERKTQKRNAVNILSLSSVLTRRSVDEDGRSDFGFGPPKNYVTTWSDNSRTNQRTRSRIIIIFWLFVMSQGRRKFN